MHQVELRMRKVVDHDVHAPDLDPVRQIVEKANIAVNREDVPLGAGDISQRHGDGAGARPDLEERCPVPMPRALTSRMVPGSHSRAIVWRRVRSPGCPWSNT